jgi:uncharacterized protein (TIRG00374 family)
MENTRDKNTDSAAWGTKLLRRAIPLVLLGVLGYLVISLWVLDPKHFHAVSQLSPAYLALAVGLTFLPWLTNSFRVANWLHFLGTGRSLKDAFRVVLISEVGAAVSPTAVGGAPAKVGVLMSMGLSTGRAISVASLGTLEDAAVALVLIPVLLSLAPLGRLPLVRELSLEHTANLGLAIAVVLGVLLALGLAAYRFRHLGPVRRILDRCRVAWRDFRELYRFVISRGWRRYLVNVLLSAVQWAARYSVITALAYGMGLTVDLLTFTLLQWVCFAAMALIPTPGAAGGAEATFLVVYGGIIPGEMMVLLMGGWRILTFYLLNVTALTILIIGLVVRRVRAKHTAQSDKRTAGDVTASTYGGSGRR